MMFLIIPFAFAFVFMCLMLYFFISLISDFVFGFREWEEERMEKWYVLFAVILCGLIWMPSFVAVMGFDNDIDYDMDNVIVNAVIKIEEEPLSIGEKHGIPEPYYLNVEKGNKNISELREVLKEIKYPHSYEECVFDCSEMSAYTEGFLENKGFDTVIYANKTWGHAWVSCSIKGHNVNIECVPPVHITSYEKYNHPENIYTDIYGAISDYPWQFDWWLQAG